MARPLKLFCFPFAGGSVWTFRELAEKLAGRVEVHPVELPGRGRRRTEPCISAWPSLIQKLSDELRPHTTAPYALLGYSLGALIALEIARELVARPEASLHDPIAFFACASRGPSMLEHAELMHRMEDKAMFDALRKLGGIPDQVLASPELIALSAPAMRADLTLYETYVPRSKPLNGIPLYAYYGCNDTSVGNSYQAWAHETDATFECRAFEGGHMFLDSEVTELANALASDLACHMNRPLIA
ncbi:thioesterase [Oleiagrimonas citrea]|uniref:Thioesterase n=1 Tax=Oleiagrimonas citrea TaxID=1665687 RepID=A0A846ZIG1_9GAMM|nr:alpha/beta fold hydrolase [Oleiagrimonas citrea]NKZ37378.1 thioesterase [Oleiagrimonas citrea]